MKIGKLEKVPLREIWKKEAKDFTRWLEKNIDYLNESLDLSFSSVEAEKSAGKFSVDLLAEDNEGKPVVIECQLEKTDHDHLGKVLTYLTWHEAKTVVWICSDPRPEHIKAMNWLNEVSPADMSFYLVKVEGVRIGESPPAPSFSVICAPSEETKDLGKTKVKIAERHIRRQEFWKQLLEKSKRRTGLHANISPGKYGFIGTGAGKSGLAYNYGITYKYGMVELYIDRGKGSEETNKQIFDALHAKKEEIEVSFGEPLIWERLDDRRGCRICRKFSKVGLKDKDKWDDLQAKMIDAMIRLESSLRSHITELVI